MLISEASVQRNLRKKQTFLREAIKKKFANKIEASVKKFERNEDYLKIQRNPKLSKEVLENVNYYIKKGLEIKMERKIREMEKEIKKEHESLAIESELLKPEEYEDFFASYKQISEEDLKGIKLG